MQKRHTKGPRKTQIFEFQKIDMLRTIFVTRCNFFIFLSKIFMFFQISLLYTIIFYKKMQNVWKFNYVLKNVCFSFDVIFFIRS